eukprot:364951-Chlamydomonas_euryale.AAC.7
MRPKDANRAIHKRTLAAAAADAEPGRGAAPITVLDLVPNRLKFSRRNPVPFLICLIKSGQVALELRRPCVGFRCWPMVQKRVAQARSLPHGANFREYFDVSLLEEVPGKDGGAKNARIFRTPRRTTLKRRIHAL